MRYLYVKKNPKSETLPKLACPICKQLLIQPGNNHLRCRLCQHTYKVKAGIPLMLPATTISDTRLKTAQSEYETLYKGSGWFRAYDESYQCLAALAKGNRTLDVACGEGWLEQLMPHVVGVDFSFTALMRAKKNGAKTLVMAAAEYLPFPDQAFDLVICNGSLEHFTNPQQALLEMKRVARIQFITAHRELPFPFSRTLRKLLFFLARMPVQPIEHPFTKKEFRQLLINAGLKPIYEGVWTFPILFSLFFPFLPKKISVPSCHFALTVHAL